MRTLPRLATATCLALLVHGCEGLVTGPSGSAEEDDGTVRGSPSPESLSCTDDDLVPSAGAVRRLSAVEYRNTVRDLFGGMSLPGVAVPGRHTGGSFDTDARAQAVDASAIDKYYAAAEELAEAAVAERDGWVGCDPSEDACLRETATGLARRAFRRPLTDGERADVESLVVDAAASWGTDDALRLLVRSLLQSPQFLYLMETGRASASPTEPAPLDAHELASRLSYFLWRTMPDAPLRAAANSGALLEEAGYAEQVDRMIDDPRTRETVRDFHAQWLELDRLEGLDLDPDRFPEADTELAHTMRESLLRFLDRAFWEGGFEYLLRSPEAFVDDELAALYGLPAPGSDELVPVTLDESRRAGLLTQAGLLASTSHGLSHSPILRGTLILERIVCSPTGAPPPDVMDSFSMEPSEEEVATTRDRVEIAHRQPQCAGCHDKIDGIGFTFENYDALGRWQTTENGAPVDSSGQLTGIDEDLQGEVDGALQLTEQFARSDKVRACVLEHWFEFGLGRRADERADHCHVATMTDALRESGGDFREALRTFVHSPAFRMRAAPREETP